MRAKTALDIYFTRIQHIKVQKQFNIPFIYLTFSMAKHFHCQNVEINERYWNL